MGRCRPERPVATIRALHADFLAFRRLVCANGNTVNFPPGAAQQLSFSNLEQLPTTTAQTIYLLTNGDEAERISWLQAVKEWALPDGSPVESTVDLLGERFEGEPHGFQVQAATAAFRPSSRRRHSTFSPTKPNAGCRRGS